jgi:gluconate 2-dehydrogenase gamma chain
MADTSQKPKDADRRTFLKIGAGVVAGAAIATVVEVPYYSSVIGGNSSSSSTSVASLQSQLSSTQEQLSSTAAQLNAAQGQVTSLNNQLSSTAAQLTSANSQLSGVNSQLTSTQQALTSANGQITSLSTQVSSLNSAVATANSQVTSLQGALTSANTQVTSLQTQTQSLMGVADALTTLGAQEALAVEAAIETLIPTDSNGPGGKEAGGLFFIDKQLAGEYGKAGNMYARGPFVPTGVSGPITIQGITYTGGTMSGTLSAGYGYQYAFNFRTFWRFGLLALESYSTSAYGGAFETLTPAVRTQVLTDLANNKPGAASFNDINPADFFSELFFMAWCGFLMDPMHGGNRGMVGWEYVAFNGLNSGNFYGEGMTTKELMVATTPTKLKPASLAQFQAASGYTAGAGGT